MNSIQTGRKATLVVPCFNEATRLDLTSFRKFINATPGFNLLFVDDGSNDRTAEILSEFVSSQPNRLALLQLATNSGKAEAVRQGFQHCAKICDGGSQYIGYLDADLATPLEEMSRAVEIAERHPDLFLIAGSRIALSGHEIRRQPRRRLLGTIFSSVASLALGLTLRDTQCGAKLFRNVNNMHGVFDSPFQDSWLFDIEILARLKNALGSRCREQIFEFPLEQWQEVAGSKLALFDFLKVPMSLARLTLYYRLQGWRPRQSRETLPVNRRNRVAPLAAQNTTLKFAQPNTYKAKLDRQTRKAA